MREYPEGTVAPDRKTATGGPDAGMEHMMTEISTRITADPQTCGGRPCIRGLRVRVKDILEMLAGGSTRQEILGDYPYLEDADITAALEFAARATDHPIFTIAEP